MAEVLNILTLPTSPSKAFSAVRTTAVDDGSAPPPRKIPRLDAASDSSASRSATMKGKGVDRKGPHVIIIGGAPENKSAGKDVTEELRLLGTSVRNLFARTERKQYSALDLPVSYETIYCACRAVVAAGASDALYAQVKTELEKGIGALARELSVKGMGESAVDWVRRFNDSCTWYKEQRELLKSLLTYLDRVYLLKQQRLLGLKGLADSLFARSIFGSDTIVHLIHVGISEWVGLERNKERSEAEQRAVMQTLIGHLIDHGQYTDVFEAFYLANSREYYKTQGERPADSPTEFLVEVERLIKKEERRTRRVLPESSWGAVRSVTETSLLEDKMVWLPENALRSLVEGQDVDLLGKLYYTYSRLDKLKLLCAAWKASILSKVQEIVTDKANDEKMVQRLLDLKSAVDTILARAFVSRTDDPFVDAAPTPSTSAAPQPQPNADFKHALADAFQSGFKARRGAPAELLAKHLDRALRKGQGTASDAEYAAALDAVLALYRYTDDRDVFRTFYHRALAKRLLLGKSASDDFEKTMLQRLKDEYDPEFGVGNHMFKDLDLSRELMRKYHDTHDATELNVMVLQRSAWPFGARKHSLALPPAMAEELTKFAAYYKANHQGHKLDWDHSLGTAQLKAYFKAGPKELSVSLYQAIVLLLFNDATELNFSDIKQAVGIEDLGEVRPGDAEEKKAAKQAAIASDKELRRTLQSLACGNKKVLKKRPVGREVHDGDLFVFNADFMDPRAKVHINSIQAKETAEETQQTHNAVEGDRKHYLDAAIVRIMKARKELSFQALTTATVDAVKNHFTPDVAMIKERIEGLVEQEYLERHEEDRNRFKYVA